MMKTYIDYDNLKIKYFKNVLYNYYFLIDYLFDLKEQEVELARRIEETCEIDGVCFDKVVSGRNDSPKVASMTRANQLSIQHATLEQKIYEVESQLKHLKRDNQINDKLKRLNKSELQILIMCFHKRMTDKEIGHIKKISPQYAHKMINTIIENMVADY